MNLRTADGRQYVINTDEEEKSGRMKDVWFCDDKVNVAAFFKKPLTARDLVRLKKITGVYRDSILRGNEPYYGSVFGLPFASGEAKHPRLGVDTQFVVLPRYPKAFFFKKGSRPESPSKLKDKEKKGRWFASAKHRRKVLHPDELGTWESHLRCCLEMCRAIAKMHQAGVAHSDLSYNNVLIDPVSGTACVIDCDMLVVVGMFPPDVAGTPDFIAPEVYKSQHFPLGDPSRVLPSQKTDLHALAVLIYQYLLYRHPLRGRLQGTLSPGDAGNDEKMLMGSEALFIEHPTDPRNRVNAKSPDNAEFLPYCDTDKIPMSVCGEPLTKLFLKAFVEGLHDPNKRPSATDWIRGIEQTLAMVVPCNNKQCQQKTFAYFGKYQCPFCGTTSYSYPQGTFYSPTGMGDSRTYAPDGASITVVHDRTLGSWHESKIGYENMSAKDSERPIKGRFIRTQTGWAFENIGFENLIERGAKKPIPPGEKVEVVNNMQLQLNTDGRILLIRIT
jgi:hypothetical protein